jgi:hypothetical protein
MRVADTPFMSRALAIIAVTYLCACMSRAPVVGLETGAAGPKEAARPSVSKVLFRSSPAEAWLMTPLFGDSTTTVSCSFDVRGMAPGTAISVDWRRGGQVLATTELSTSRDTRRMSADLVLEAPLASGAYDVEIRVGGRTAATSSFRIAGGEGPAEPAPRPTAPRVLAVTLSVDECVPDPSARGGAAPTFSGGVSAVQLCLQYENIAAGQRLVVRWYLSSSPSRPLAEATYTPTGDGELSDHYAYSEPIPPGAYHVVVTLGGREVTRQRFVVAP